MEPRARDLVLAGSARFLLDNDDCVDVNDDRVDVNDDRVDDSDDVRHVDAHLD